MRKEILAIAAACLMTTPIAFGQTHNSNPAQHHRASIEMRVQHRVNFLTTVLSLTSSQEQKATTIFTNAAKEDSTVFANLKTARQQLSTDVKSNEPTSAIMQVSNTIGNYVGQLVANEASAYEPSWGSELR